MLKVINVDCAIDKEKSDLKLLESILFEIENIPNNQTTKIRKKIISVIKKTKKDKEQLNYQ